MATQCPVCNKDSKPRAENSAFPFCRNRCRMVDLGNWFGGGYQVSRPIDPEGDAEAIREIMDKNEGSAQ